MCLYPLNARNGCSPQHFVFSRYSSSGIISLVKELVGPLRSSWAAPMVTCGLQLFPGASNKTTLGSQVFSSVAPCYWGMFSAGSLCFRNDDLGALIQHDMMCLPELGLGSKALPSQSSCGPQSPHSSCAEACSCYSNGFSKTAPNFNFLLSLHSRECRLVWLLQHNTNCMKWRALKTEYADFSCCATSEL